MKLNSFNNGFLRSAATDAPEGGGGAVQQEEQQAKPIGKKPGVVQMALAGLQDKATLNNRIKELEGQVAALTADNATLTSENARLAAEVQEYEADYATLSAALDGEKQTTKNVDLAAAAKIVDLGFTAKNLPEGRQEEEGQMTREELEAAINKETDAQKIWDLTEKLAALG